MSTIVDVRRDNELISIGDNAPDNSEQRVFEGLMMQKGTGNQETDLYLNIQKSLTPDKEIFESLTGLGWWNLVNTDEPFENDSAAVDIDATGPLICLGREIDNNAATKGLIIGQSGSDVTDIFFDLPSDGLYQDDEALKYALELLGWWSYVNV